MQACLEHASFFFPLFYLSDLDQTFKQSVTNIVSWPKQIIALLDV